MNTEPDQLRIERGKAAWEKAVALLVSVGCSESKARSFFGGVLKKYNLHASDLLPALESCRRTGTAYPAAYIFACAREEADRQNDSAMMADWT